MTKCKGRKQLRLFYLMLKGPKYAFEQLAVFQTKHKTVHQKLQADIKAMKNWYKTEIGFGYK